MANSRPIAALLGPSLMAITLSEAWNIHIWAANTPPVIHLNGALLFVAGLSIVRAHNAWIRGWPEVVTLVGWFAMLLGLIRMFVPELVLHGVLNTSAVVAAIAVVLVIGFFLTIQGYGPKKIAMPPSALPSHRSGIGAMTSSRLRQEA
jgi:hypothetical protein